MQVIDLPDENATLRLGAWLGSQLRAGDVVALTGGLGAGKTTLSRGLVQALTGETDVPSPTYTLIQTYEGVDCDIWHCDLYRLETPDDVYELGLLDAFEEAICLIEWPDKLGALLPETVITLDIDFNETGRVVKLSGVEGRYGS